MAHFMDRVIIAQIEAAVSEGINDADTCRWQHSSVYVLQATTRQKHIVAYFFPPSDLSPTLLV